MFESDLLSGKRILITGGGTGLGRAMAGAFMERGADVVLTGRRETVLRETKEQLSACHNRPVETARLDIRDAGAVEETIAALWRKGPLTGLVNNAAGNFISRTEDISANGFNAIAATVMQGTFYVTHAVGRRWIAEDLPGDILSIVTTWVRNGSPFVVPSAMSKSAVHAMTMSLAAEWARHDIRLNAIAPGYIPTEGMAARLTPGGAAGENPGSAQARANPMGRNGTFEELGNLATFLMSDGCRWLTGETIAMDGAHGRATGGNFHDLTSWDDAEWQAARAAIQGQNAKDKAGRAPAQT